MMKRLILVILAVMALAVSACASESGGVAGQNAADAEPATLVEQELDNTIWASGKLLPVRWASLGFEIGGQVAAVDVAEGDQVVQGQRLATLVAPEARAAVAQAEAARQAAQAQLDLVRAQARPEQIAAAEAAVQAAQAQQEAAQAALATAQGNVAAAQAQVGVAQAAYNQVKAGPRSEEITAARQDVEQARAVLQQAQAAYDRVASSPDIGMLPQAVALQQATAAFNAAQARFQAFERGSTAEDLAMAESQIAAARSQVVVAETGVAAAQAQAASATAAVAQAQAQLDLLRAGARVEDVAVAEAAVAQAQATMDAARGALAKGELLAPFDGTVSAVQARPGEVVQSGQEVVMMGDLHQMRVETTDLRETDVARVRLGQVVDVTFDALPDQVFQGTVTRIAPMSTAEQGSVNYTAIVELDELDPALRWGMTAFINIETR
jgi:multidrug resistance efflux pump